MAHLALFLGLTFLAGLLLAGIQFVKPKLKPSSLLGLFLFGIWLSVPFVIVEVVGSHLKYYFMVLAFILIESTVVVLEHKWKYLHHLVHHNVKHLRIFSYFLIAAGFTYSELVFYALHSEESVKMILMSLPFKALFAVFIHTVITSSTALIEVTESAFQHIMLFVINYLRLVFISVSHYLYVFVTEHRALYLIFPFAVINLWLFFRHKRYLEEGIETVI